MHPGGYCLTDLQALVAGHLKVLGSFQTLSPSLHSGTGSPCPAKAGQACPAGTEPWGGSGGREQLSGGFLPGSWWAPMSLSFGLLDWESAPSRGRLALSWRGHPRHVATLASEGFTFCKMRLGHLATGFCGNGVEEDLSRATGQGLRWEERLPWNGNRCDGLRASPLPGPLWTKLFHISKVEIVHGGYKNSTIYRCWVPCGVLSCPSSSSCF